jgi:tetratricopeptide (TPR) repeat protein
MHSHAFVRATARVCLVVLLMTLGAVHLRGQELVGDLIAQARSLAASKQTKAALAVLDRAVASYPQTADAWLERGMLKLDVAMDTTSRVKDWTGARVDIQRSIDLDPQSARGYFWRGFWHATDGKDPLAVADYDRALAIDASVARYWWERGHARMRRFNYKAAREDYLQALRLDPTDEDIRDSLRAMDEKLGLPPTSIPTGAEPARRQTTPAPPVPQRLVPTPPAPEAQRTAPALAPLKPGDTLAETTVGPEGGAVDAAGAVSLQFPPGALARAERVTIRTVADAPARARLFLIDRQGTDPLAKPVTVTLQVPANRPAGRPVSVTHLDGPLFVEVPGSRYDAASGTLTFDVTHFSPLGVISSADVKSAGGAAIGAVIGIYLVTPAGVLTLSGIAIVAGLGLVGGAAANPVVDAAEFAQANMAVQFGDRFRIRWVDDASNQSHVADKESFAAFVNTSSGAVIGFDQKLTAQERGDLDASGLRPILESGSAGVKIVRIPRCVIYTAAELFWAEMFYRKAGFTTPTGGGDPMPTPMEVLVLYAVGHQGLWDGTKLNLDSGVVARLSVLQTTFHLTRQAVIAHEYWHAVFTFAGYSATYDWWNEAQAVAFESEVFPDRTAFLTDHPAADVAVSLRTGFATTGTSGTEADWSTRGYKLWPWGKFLLHRGYKATIDFGRGRMSQADISTLFTEFGMALICIERQLPDRATISTPDDAFNRPTYVIQFPEGMDAASFSKSTSTSTGWASLNLDTMRSPLTVGLGDASRNRANLAAEVIIPRPMSFSLIQAAIDPSLAVVALATARTPPPLVVRREAPAAGESVVALHPSNKDPVTARRRLSDIAMGEGVAVVPWGWFDWTAQVGRRLDLALINSAASGGGRTPLWVYFLLPPSNVKVARSANQARGGAVSDGTLSISEPQLIFTWKTPELGTGLTAPRVLTGYRVFTQKGKAEPTMVAGVLLPTDAETALVPAGLVGPYDRIGVASEDAVVKDRDGKPLLSPVQWYAPESGKVQVFVSEVNPKNNSPFAEDITIPVVGAAVAVEYVEKGQPISKPGVTDKNGRATFDVPLDVVVTAVFGKERKEVTCTSATPEQAVGFGGLKIRTVETIKR